MPTTSSHNNMELVLPPAHEAYYGGVAGQAHNETAFHYILNIERRRAERAEQSVSLVLVRRVNPGRSVKIDAAAAAGIFSALGESVREADLIGWYRQDIVAGAVLIQPPGPPHDIRHLLTSRVTDALREKMPKGRTGFRVLAVSLRDRRQVVAR